MKNLALRRLTLVSLLSLVALTAIVGLRNQSATGAGLSPGTAVGVSSAATGPESILDHFKCWVVKDSNTPSSVVYLQDQFDAGPPGTTAGSFESVVVDPPDFFCNPTRKLHAGIFTGIVNPDDHLTCYQITDAAGSAFQPRSVVVQNQFGSQTIDVVKPTELCAPTQKILIDDKKPPTGGGVPLDLDHFKCYDVKGSQLKEPVSLQDEFDLLQSPNHLENVRVGQPVLLCNPVRKAHFFGFSENDLTASGANFQIFPVLHPEAHLLCYRITPPEQQPHSLLIRNQFGTQQLSSTRSELLCVPSLKFEIPPRTTPTPTATPCPAGSTQCTPTPTATPCVSTAGNICTPTPTATPCPATLCTPTPTPCTAATNICTPTATPTPACPLTNGCTATPTPTPPCDAANCSPTPTPTCIPGSSGCTTQFRAPTGGKSPGAG
jgi:hypothetical protein